MIPDNIHVSTARFAMVVSTDSKDFHVFGMTGTDAHRAALAIEQGWRSETRPGAYYLLAGSDGAAAKVYVRDIIDVSVTVGARR